jgi:hypothetical protein
MKWIIYKYATRIYDWHIPVLRDIADKIRELTYEAD